MLPALNYKFYFYYFIPASIKDGLRVFVSGPSGFLDSCYFVPSPNSNTHYSIGFIPKEVGLHLVHVNDGKKPLPGKYFTFNEFKILIHLVCALKNQLSNLIESHQQSSSMASKLLNISGDYF